MSFFFFLGAVVAIVSGIWLLFLAFKEHILWGLGSLLVPFVSLIFVIMHWRKSWRPFVFSLAGTGMMVAGLLTSLPSADALQDLATVHAELQRRVDRGEMTEAEVGRELARISLALLGGEEYTPDLPPKTPPSRPAKVSAAAAPPPRPKSPKPSPPEPPPPEPPRTRVMVQEYEKIDFRQAPRFVGRRARVRMRSGLIREGILGPPDSRYLTLVHRVAGGDISYHIEPEKTARIEVLAWVEVDE